MITSSINARRDAVAKPTIDVFERSLTVWVALCIVAGIALGRMLPGVFQRIGRIEYRTKGCMRALDATGENLHE